MAALLTYDIVVNQGEDFLLPMVYKDSLGNPVDLTGYSIRMQVRYAVDNPENILDISDTPGPDGQFTLGGLAGTIDLTIPRSVTETLRPAVYVYDVELTDGTDSRKRFLEGEFSVSAECTRS